MCTIPKILQRIGMVVTMIGIASWSLYAQVDDRGVDTTGIGYRIGREIGNWLPFLVIISLALLVIYRSYNFSQEQEQE